MVKTVFVFVWQGRSNRYLLRTGFLGTLKGEDRLRIVIVSPIGDEEEFKKELEDKNVFVEKWPRTKIAFWESRLKNLKDYIWVSRCATRTVRILRRGRYGWFALFFRDLIGKLALALGITEERVNNWEIKIYKEHPEIKRLYDRYQPDLVLYTRHFASNLHVVKEAKKRGIPAICLVEGLDNLTSKTAMSVIPDRMIVWNEIMRDEATRLHRYPPEHIDVVGPPPFDPYCDSSRFVSRHNFFMEYGLDPNRRLVTYATAAERVSKDEIEVVNQLYEAIQSGQLGVPAQLLVRLHPITSDGLRSEYLRRFSSRPYVVVQSPGRWARLHDGWDPTWADMIMLASTMYHSDVVVNIFSTIAIDAAIVDTPVVSVAFDGKENRPYLRSCRRYVDYDHYQNLIQTGGVRVAYSFSDLARYVGQYLKDPEMDQAGRARILKEQCHFWDGRAGYRAAQVVLRELGLAQGLEIKEEIVSVKLKERRA